MNIYVGNLPYSATEVELRELFEQFGSVISTNIIMDRETGQSKGFGFIEMASDDEGRQALEQLDGSELDGRSLKVNEARPREERGGGGGGGGGQRGGNRGGGHRGGGGGQRGGGGRGGRSRDNW